MKNRLYIAATALLVAAALVALSAGLFSSVNTVHAAPPVFADGSSTTRSVPENTPPGVNIGTPISATDDDETTEEYGQTLTYSLGGTDAASFDIDASTGQLITKAPLDAEGTASYTVTVTVDDGETRETPVETEVTISVTDVVGSEKPLAPDAPTVVSGEADADPAVDESTVSLKVVWSPPDNMGRPAIGTYAVQYKETTKTDFIDWTRTGDAGSTIETITGLTADTSYDVRVQATNSDGAGLWSLSGTGSTNKANNSPPKFQFTADPTDCSDADICREMPENQSSGQNVGTAIPSASDANSVEKSYELVGSDKDLFVFDTSSRHIRTKRGVTYDFEAKSVYWVTVTVSDGHGATDAVRVKIELSDVAEPPDAPTRPTVRAAENSSTSLDVSWNAPENAGRPTITGYKLEYREGSTGEFTSVSTEATDTTMTSFRIVGPTPDGLKPGTSYQVRVWAVNAEGGGAKSVVGTGRTSPANRDPEFNDGAGPITRYVNENTLRDTQAVRNVGARVGASDRDGDRLTYSLGGEDATLFDIDERTGQIKTKTLLTHEDATGCDYVSTEDPTSCTYTVTVQVQDGLDNHRVKEDTATVDDTIKVSINVRDLAEPPAAPDVTVTSPGDGTTLQVIWDEADNTGPAIAGYAVEYRTGSSVSTLTAVPTDRSGTITGLNADTRYDVRVRATTDGSDEGEGAWSRWVTISTNKSTNTAPVLSATAERSVAENTSSGQNIGDPVTATETDTDDRVTYSLEGPGGRLFTIDTGTGQIKTRSALNHEDPACGYDDDDTTTTCSYTVRVKAVDRNRGSAASVVTINVTDDPDEAPSAPNAPTVRPTAGTGRSLDVSWSVPRNNGPPISGFDIQYREYRTDGGGTFTNRPPNDVNDDGRIDTSLTSATITDLAPGTSYEVRVRAITGEAAPDTGWSRATRASTSQGNKRPEFETSGPITLTVVENTPSGRDVGSAVLASDDDGSRNRLRYTLEGPGAVSFTINASTGQIRTRSPLDYESREFYSLTVRVDDGSRTANSSAAKSVTVRVNNENEVPSVPSAPRVTGVPGSTDSIQVIWDEPANKGPDITGYDVDYRRADDRDGGFDSWTHDGVDRSTIITGLTAGTRYSVRVRARNADGGSDWSRVGTGASNPDVANRNPAFSGGARTFSVAENTAANTDVGTPVSATDRDGDPLRYSLEGADAASFEIISTFDGGQIRTSTELNHEEKSSYSVTVRVTDGRGGSDALNVTIRVTDEPGEAPSTPDAPTVTAVSSTSLQVSWEEPENEGPAITDYDYRFKEASESTWTEIAGTTIRGTTVTISSLTADTFYDVEVRAKNDEGTSDWSIAGFGATAAPGANNPPVFSEGVSATRSVSASAPADAAIGPPLTATDADSGDTLTYNLEGRDATFFDIDGTNGQLSMAPNAALIAGETYEVTVTASDGSDTARIEVAITATAAPPNNRPVFSEGTSTTRSVARSATAGTAIGQPVTATDADTGDTLTYTLEGTDAASFRINRSTGQLFTQAGVTLVRTSYSVTVVATDNRAARAAIAVTISATNSAPAFSSASTTRNVARSATAGTAIGQPITATDADTGDTLTYRLQGTDAASFRINSSTGQLLTQAALLANSYTVTVVATDQANASARINVTINVANRAPQFSEATTSRTVDRNALVGAVIGAPVTATDADLGDLLAYRLSGADAASFRINSSTGQLATRAGVTLDVASYSVTVIATDQAGETASIGVTINIANSAPVFSETSTTRSVERGTPAGTAIGDPVTATDADVGDRLAYSLGGADRASFRINGSTGQLLTRAGVTLDAASYAVTVVATDELAVSASIAVTITVANAAPAFSDTSSPRTVGRNAAENTPIGDPVTATDADPGDTLTYSLAGADAASFGIESSTGQLLTLAGVTFDRASYSITVVATDGFGAAASISVTITVANAAPAFSDATATRTVDRDAPADTSIGAPFTATDADPGDTLTYSLGGEDNGSFQIDGSDGQLLTMEGVSLDEDSYAVTVIATDGLGATATISVTINVTDGDSLLRRFDTDEDGTISEGEAFGAVLEFLSGQASRDEILGVILLFIAQ